MFLPKLPDDKQYGLMFSNASGKALDVYGEMYGLPRKRFELNAFYKRRLARHAIKEAKS
jgi:hypothetical protein